MTSKPSKLIVSTTEVDGNKANRQVAWKNKPKSKNNNLNFAGVAKLDSGLYQKVVTSGTSQDGQNINSEKSIKLY